MVCVLCVLVPFPDWMQVTDLSQRWTQNSSFRFKSKMDTKFFLHCIFLVSLEEMLDLYGVSLICVCVCLRTLRSGTGYLCNLAQKCQSS